MSQIEQIMEAKGTPTLKAIAGVFGLQATRLYTVAKTPKEGEVYDAKVYNWEAVERFLERRLGQHDFPETLEEVIDKALELDEEYKEMDGRRSSNRGIAAAKTIEVDGKMIPERRYSNHEMYDADGNVQNSLIAFKKDPAVYKIVLQTRSHTVVVPVEDASGNVVKSEVKVVSNFMMNHKGYNPVANQEEVDRRFSGEFEVETYDTVTEE